MAAPLEYPATHEDLLTGRTVGVLTTIGPDGLPQSTAVWFLLDDDGVLKLSMMTVRQKCKNLARTPKATLFLMDPQDSGRNIEIRADVDLVVDADKSFVAKVAAKYGVPPSHIDPPDSTRMIAIFDPQRVNHLP